MNKKIFLLLPALGLLLCGCQPKGGEDVPPTPGPGPVVVDRVEIDHETLSLEVGQTFQLAASVKPIQLEDRTYTWSSDAATVASVDASGMVTAVEEGTAHIRATANADTTKYAECTVTVTPEMVTVALTDPAAIMASTETLKFGANQKNVGGYYYFTGSVNGDNRGNTSASWAEAVQVKLEDAGSNKYYITMGEGAEKQYFEMNDSHRYEIVSTPTAGREWDWNSTYGTVQRTISGQSESKNNGTFLPGTYNTFTNISGCNLEQADSDFFYQFVYKTRPVEPTTVTLSAASDKIYQGGTLQVEAELGPAGAAGELVWSVTGDEHVTIDQKGLVSATAEATLNAEITVKAAYAEDETVFGTLNITVAELINYGTLENPLTIAEAKAIIDKFPSGTPEVAYVKGLVSSSEAYSTKYNNWGPIWLTDGETEKAFEGYRLKDGSSDGSFATTYAAENSLLGKTVTMSGVLKKYNTTYETDGGNDSKLLKVEDIPVNPTSIVLNPSETFEIEQGGNKAVTAKLMPFGASGTVTFAVSPADQGVSYADGKVIATAEATTGAYTLTATCGALNASVDFTVAAAGAEHQTVVADFTLKTANHSAYNDTWKYGDFTVAGGANNNGAWAFVKMGGKSTTISAADHPGTWIKTNNAIAFGVKTVTLDLVGKSYNQADEKAVVTIYSYSDAECTTQVGATTSQEVPAITTNEGTASLNFTFATPTANLYYKVSFAITNTTSYNGVVALAKVTFSD